MSTQNITTLPILLTINRICYATLNTIILAKDKAAAVIVVGDSDGDDDDDDLL